MSARGASVVIAAVIAVALAVSLATTVRMRMNDGAQYFYGARCLFHGRDPYDHPTILREWERDGSPRGVKLDLPCYLSPPIQAVAIAPAIPFHWPVGRYVLNLLSFAEFLLTGWLLMSLAMVPWSPKTKVLFWLLLPWGAFNGVMYLGQVSPFTCLMMAAALVALKRRREVAAGLFLALALSKFTLVLPLLCVALYRGYWRAAAVAVTAFLAVNLLFALAPGPVHTVEGMEWLIRYSTEPNHVNDAGGTHGFNFSTIVQAKRLFYMVLGQKRPLVEGVNAGFTLLAVLIMAWVLRPRRGAPPVFDHPLEVAVVVAAALSLLYHRHTDLTALAFVVYALLEYRNRWPDRQPRTWGAAVGLTLVAAYQLNFYSRLPVIPGLVERFTGISSLGPLSVLALFLLLLWMLAFDLRRHAEAAGLERAVRPAVVA